MLGATLRDGSNGPHNEGEFAQMLRPALQTRVAAAVSIAARHAAEVDRDGRFPAEAFGLIREHGLLGLMVPSALGGEAAGVATLADVCFQLGQACSSTGMIFAMHQVKLACLAHHADPGSWCEGFLRRLAREPLLLASSTTEGQGGGDVRSSAAPIVTDGDRIQFQRDATVMSYGAQADAIVTTARRSTEAAASDQVLAVFLKEDYSLTERGGWDTMGMRGTCSAGFDLVASGHPGQVLATPYETIHSRTMTPVAHLLWSAVWAGIAAAAVARAQAFIRKAARSAGGKLPPGAPHLTRAAAQLASLRNLVAAAVRRYEEALADDALLTALPFQTAITLHKVEASELAAATVLTALRACGLSGYRNDGEASVARLLRDILSAPLMINNERILQSLTTATLMSPVPTTLF